MTALGSGFDLVEQAERRARLAALLGRLLVAEPGPHLAPLVGGVGGLEPLASADPSLAVEYERLLLREVPVYESVFLGDDGRRGGDRASALAAVYEACGFDDAGHWRVAGPDHLGLELLCYAHLCAQEAAGWRDELPDMAAVAVDTARSLLADHLGQWGEVSMAALARRAGSSPYGAVADAVASFLAGEAERLRPAPDHPGLPPVAVDAPPPRLGPARLARLLLSPAQCGAFLDHADLAAAARGLGIPWRPSDPRSRFREVVEDAADGGDLDVLVEGLRPALAWWRALHADREAACPGASRVWQSWRLRVEATLALLDRVGQAAPSKTSGSGPVVVAVYGVGLLAPVLARLRPVEAVVAVSVDIDERLAAVLAAGAEQVELGGTGYAAGPSPGPADIVVRVLDAQGRGSGVELDPDDHRPLADAARRVLAGLDPGEVDP